MIIATTTQRIQAHGDNLFVATNVIAELFDRPHKNLMRDIDRLIEAGSVNALNLERITYTDSRGRAQTAYRLCERDALVLMPFLGGRKAADGQARLVDEFLRMRHELRRLGSRKADPLLQQANRQKCAVATLMTDCLVEVRMALGKETKPHHYSNEHSLCNWVLTGQYGQVDDSGLDRLELRRLTDIRRRNTVLIVTGLNYAVRKDALREAFPLLQLEHAHD
jgi:phage regulator Rha-like protein